MSLKERRVSRRFLMRLPLTVRWTDENVVGEADTESREVSSRGVYFHLPKGLRSGSASRDRYDPAPRTDPGWAGARSLSWDACCAAARKTQAKWELRQRSNATNSCGNLDEKTPKPATDPASGGSCRSGRRRMPAENRAARRRVARGHFSVQLEVGAAVVGCAAPPAISALNSSAPRRRRMPQHQIYLHGYFAS